MSMGQIPVGRARLGVSGRRRATGARLSGVAAAAVMAMWGGSSYAQSIGFNFVGGQPAGASTLADTDVAGVIAQPHWNNLAGQNQALTLNSYYDNAGNALSLTTAWDSPNTWALNGTVPGDPNGKLMNGYIDSNASGAATNNLTVRASQPYLTLSGLSGPYTSRGYKVILYVDGDNGGDTRTAQYWLTTFSGNLANVGGETALTPHFYMADNAGANFSGAFTQVTSTTAGAPSAGNYIVFDGLTSPNFVVRADEIGGGTLRAPINAVQVVANPIVNTIEWNGPGGGNWFTPANWVGGVVPNDNATVAQFLTKINANATVNLDQPVTIRGLKFDNPTRSYTLSGGNGITLDTGGFGDSTIQVVSGTHTINVQLNPLNSVTFDTAAGSQLIMGANASINAGAAFNVTKTGAGTLVLNTGGSWGTLNANGGIITLGAQDLIPGGSDIGGSGGTIDVNGFSQTLRRLNGSPNVTNSSNNPAVLNIGLGGGIGVYGGTVSGNLSMVISGGGRQSLLAGNTFTGTVQVIGTELRTEANNALGSTNAATILDGGTLNLWNTNQGAEPLVVTDAGGNLSDRGVISGPITLGNAPLVINANSGVGGSVIELDGNISGPGKIQKLDNNGLLLAGNSTFAGGIDVVAGFVAFGSDATATTSPAGTGPINLMSNGVGLRTQNGSHTVSNNVFATADFTVDPSSTNAAVLTLTGTMDLGGPPRTITANADLTLAGKVTNGGIIKAGNGVLTLTNSANDFNGGIVFQAGAVSISNLNQLGPAGQQLTFNGGLLRVTGTGITSMGARAANVNWNGFSGGFDVADPANTFTVSDAITGSGFFQKAGAGTLLLTNAGNTYSGGTIVDGGVLKITTGGALPDNGNVTVNGGSLDFNGFSKTIGALAGSGTAAAVINSGATGITLTVGAGDQSGSFAGSIKNANNNAATTLVKIGTGTQTLAGANTYTGATTVSAGTLNVTGSLASTPVTVQNNATLAGNGLITGAVSVLGGGTIFPASGTMRVGTLNLASGSKLNFNLGSPVTAGTLQVTTPGGLTVNGGQVTILPTGILAQGTYPLIRYSGALGGNFSNLSLTNASSGDTLFSLSNLPGQSINLVVGTSLQIWQGTVNGDWDTTTANWTGASTTYANGKAVRFDDTATATAINVVNPVTPSRIDLANATKDLTFSGAAIGGPGAPLNKSGNAKVIFNQPLTFTGATTVNGGVVQLNGPATLNQTSGITLNNLGPRPLDATGALAAARGGTLYLADDTVPNRLGTVPVTMNGGTLVAAKGPTAGAGSVTVQNVNANIAMNRLIAGSNGSPFVLNVGNLTRGPDATVDFRTVNGTLGGTGDNGQIKIAQLNGGAFSTANLNNGLIGAWATTGDNFASYDNAVGVIPNATNVSTNINTADGNTNVRDTSATNLNFTGGNLTVNSLISGADVIVPAASTVTINSGAAMMSGPNKWWQNTDNANAAFVQAGPGVSQMVFTVLDPGTDHRLRWKIQDNGTPLNFIKNGDGWLRLNEANTYTGQTIVNAGTLALSNASSLGAGTLPVIVRSGATLDLRNQDLGQREVIISGGGVSDTNGASVGALINTSGGVIVGAIHLTLAADATIGGTGRWDVRGTGATVNGGTFTLTKVGTNQISFVQPDSVSVGNIVINAGSLSFEQKNDIMGDPNFTATINPAGTLMLWNSLGGMSQNKPIVLNGGRILGQNNPNTLTGPIRIDATGIVQTDTDMTFTNTVFGAGGISKTGTATLILPGQNVYTGPTTVNAGTLRVTGSIGMSSGVTVNNGAFDAAATQSVNALTVAGGTAIVSVGTLKVGNNTTATPLATSGNGRVDLRNNAMVVDYSPGNAAPAMQSVRSLIVAGYNNGAFNGTGIASTTVAATPGRAIGYAQASEILGPAGGTFLGQTADADSVLVRQTLFGDANLDGAVDFNDLVRLAQNYNTAVSETSNSWWYNGDFNYDGNVDFNDLVKLAQNYNTALPTEPVPGAPVNFGAELAAAFAAVPEPGTVGFLGLAGCAVLSRRRRRRTACNA